MHRLELGELEKIFAGLLACMVGLYVCILIIQRL